MSCEDKKVRFFRCKVCGKIIVMINPTGAPTICCGREMEELIPQKDDMAAEKHVPVVSNVGRMVTVKVGSVAHPMEQNHYIQWVAVQTEEGFQITYLQPGQKPEAEFFLEKGPVLNVWEYCSVHGLWEA